MDGELIELTDILKEIDSISSYNHNSRCGISYQRTQKLKATQAEDELSQITYLVDSHVSSLREKAAMSYEKLMAKEDCMEYVVESQLQLKLLKNFITTKCPTNLKEDITEIRRIVAEMPKEWTVIQLTAENDLNVQENCDIREHESIGLSLSVFNCGQDQVDPFLIFLDPPVLRGTKLDLLQLFATTLEDHCGRLVTSYKKKFFKNYKEKQLYKLKTEEIACTVKDIVKNIEKNWLRHWRCLLIGKYQDETLEQAIWKNLDAIFKTQLKNVYVPGKMKQLLYYLTKGASYLAQQEILTGVEYCLRGVCTDKTIIKEVAELIKNTNIKIYSENVGLKHPVILIIDETLDSLPWEMMEVLKNKPVSRVPSLHFLYFLFKAHEKDIVNGLKIIPNYENGKFIINPDQDLEAMETRMMTFYKYWTPNWNGINGQTPTNEQFYELLKTANIFAYSGHGNGAHLISVEMLQKIRVNAVVLLFGCASTKISKLGPQIGTYGSYHMYLISQCPCVMGMLWPVTDLSTDMFTTDLMSLWIPSVASVPWMKLRHSEKFLKCDSFTKLKPQNCTESGKNLELLRVLSHCKSTYEYNYMTQAACVVRGLPVKLVPK